jgi:hypothetical protein
VKDEISFEEEIDENLCVVEAVFQPIRDELHGFVKFIENMALDACLDGFGWTFPTDPEDWAGHE